MGFLGRFNRVRLNSVKNYTVEKLYLIIIFYLGSLNHQQNFKRLSKYLVSIHSSC